MFWFGRISFPIDDHSCTVKKKKVFPAFRAAATIGHSFSRHFVCWGQILREPQFALDEELTILRSPPEKIPCRSVGQPDDGCPRSLVLILESSQTMDDVYIFLKFGFDSGMTAPQMSTTLHLMSSPACSGIPWSLRFQPALVSRRLIHLLLEFSHLLFIFLADNFHFLHVTFEGCHFKDKVRFFNGLNLSYSP